MQLKTFHGVVLFGLLILLFIITPNTPGYAGLTVTPIGKTYTPDKANTPIIQDQSNSGGNTSVRYWNNPPWKDQGYYMRSRDLGQVITIGDEDIVLDAIVLRTGPANLAVCKGAPGAKVFIQFFAVEGDPVINDNGTPPGTDATHGWTKNHRADDYVEGITYKPIHLASGGVFPDIPLTQDGGTRGNNIYMRWDLTGEDEIRLNAGKRYAFMIGFENAGPDRNFTLRVNQSHDDPAPPSFDDAYSGGWGLRREGNGEYPPIMRPGEPDTSLLYQSMFPSGGARYQLPPQSDGYPDVSTYHDLEFYIEAKTIH